MRSDLESKKSIYTSWLNNKYGLMVTEFVFTVFVSSIRGLAMSTECGIAKELTR
uniref:AlNc14C24G2455 protein n=1 Tax=Albugo laibachii Nc14 TaxID=890382 RepID=F0W6F6_9STRA|nr:AlNc14C24G2455 [Albugo laibachii Nc14]|eukprot:CCA16700.1 AlNc14C24G2455 [Albugo laibachii Nc14]